MQMKIGVRVGDTWWLETVHGMSFEAVAEFVGKNGLHTSDQHGPVFFPPQVIECIRPVFDDENFLRQVTASENTLG